MLGAIAGDVIGSVFERHNVKTTEFPLFSEKSRFTDDTVLTVAVADALLHGEPFGEAFRRYYRAYPDAGYGRAFRRWARNPHAGAYGSWGNGSAMRASPVGWAYDKEEDVLAAARKTALPTHNHPEGIKGAEAIALAVFLARQGHGRHEIVSKVAARAGYDLDFTLDDIRSSYRFDVSCRGSVPQALVAFRDSMGFEHAIRTAISIGGDSDTIACMAGAIAEAFYGGVPAAIKATVRARLTPDLNAVVEAFYAQCVRA